MKIFLSKSARILIKAIRKELRNQQLGKPTPSLNFGNGTTARPLLCPRLSTDEYEQAVREICSRGMATEYIRGGFKLTPKGTERIMHPIASFVIPHRADIISISTLIISFLTLLLNVIR